MTLNVCGVNEIYRAEPKVDTITARTWIGRLCERVVPAVALPEIKHQIDSNHIISINEKTKTSPATAQ